VKIPKKEFADRAARLREKMREQSLDACFVYGDEYRRENLRYLSNVWPIFERGAVLLGRTGDPIVLGAPEGELLAKEMTAWDDVRLVPEFACVTVPEEIEYPFANYTTFRKVFAEVGVKARLGIVGLDAMPQPLYEIIRKAADGAELVDCGEMLWALRLRKSDAEIACIVRAIEIADAAYTELMRAAVPGVTELELMGVAAGTAHKLGAENVPFCLVSSGERVKTIIGRATDKVVENGDMVMAALAVQYEGYIATFGFPFVCGDMSDEQRQLISWLIGAYETAIGNLKAGVPQNKLVIAVKNYFRDAGIGAYDLYPPLHGCGLSEAESPYPNEKITRPFESGMTVNTDISVFGHPYGSNRIETGFVVTDEGCVAPSKLFEKLISAWKQGKSYREVL
jgi:Xaa-Pro aminopeptidase